MRTLHAHYGCGTAFGVAVCSGVPAVEMLAVTEWQGGERERWRWMKETGRDGEDLADKSEEDKGVKVE